MMPVSRLLLPLLFLPLFSCTTTKGEVEHPATARVAPDFETYTIHRVGLVPLLGRPLDAEQAQVLQSALFSELSRETPYEIVPLVGLDLEYVEVEDPYLRGRYDPQTIIDLSRRFLIPALLSRTRTRERRAVVKAFIEGRFPAIAVNRRYAEGIDTEEVTMYEVESVTPC